MRYSFLLTVVISFVSVSSLDADDGLFSELAMESVFETPATSNPVATKNMSGTLDRITGVSTLIETLKVAGFEANESDGRAAFALDHASWRFPVSMAVQIDQDRIDCRMSLVKIDDSGQASSKTLLQLLAAGDSRGTSFAYDPESKTIQVRASLSNRSITASELKADLFQMAGFAEKHADLWSKSIGGGTTELPSTPASNSTSKPVANSVPKSGSGSASKSASVSAKAGQVDSLIGRWSSSLSSNEAFAIEITADSKFKLVHLKSGKSTISTGKITRSGDQMKLVGDQDVTLDSTVTQTTGDVFALAIKDAAGNAALTLQFKKAK